MFSDCNRNSSFKFSTCRFAPILLSISSLFHFFSSTKRDCNRNSSFRFSSCKGPQHTTHTRWFKVLASPPLPSVSRLYFISPLPLNVQRPQISNQLHACNYMLCREVAATPPAWRVRALRCPLNKRVRWRMAPPPLNSHPYPPSWGG